MLLFFCAQPVRQGIDFIVLKPALEGRHAVLSIGYNACNHLFGVSRTHLLKVFVCGAAPVQSVPMAGRTIRLKQSFSIRCSCAAGCRRCGSSGSRRYSSRRCSGRRSSRRCRGGRSRNGTFIVIPAASRQRNDCCRDSCSQTPIPQTPHTDPRLCCPIRFGNNMRDFLRFYAACSRLSNRRS